MGLGGHRGEERWGGSDTVSVLIYMRIMFALNSCTATCVIMM